jgi:hypothetical protein
MIPNYTLQRPEYALQTGWTPIPMVVTRTGNLEIEIDSNRSTYISVDDKILLTQGTTDKYFTVAVLTVVDNTTTIQLTSTSGAVVSDEPIIYAYFSKLDRPYGLPAAEAPGCQFKTGIFMTPHGREPMVQSITDVGFKPKAIIFLGICGQTPSVENGIGVGITDGLRSFSEIGYTTDGGSSGGEGPTENTVFQQIDIIGGITISANLTSLDDDGFTLTYSIVTPNPYNVAWLAMG